MPVQRGGARLLSWLTFFWRVRIGSVASDPAHRPDARFASQVAGDAKASREAPALPGRSQTSFWQIHWLPRPSTLRQRFGEYWSGRRAASSVAWVSCRPPRPGGHHSDVASPFNVSANRRQRTTQSTRKRGGNEALRCGGLTRCRATDAERRPRSRVGGIGVGGETQLEPATTIAMRARRSGALRRVWARGRAVWKPSR